MESERLTGLDWENIFFLLQKQENRGLLAKADFLAGDITAKRYNAEIESSEYWKEVSDKLLLVANKDLKNEHN